jgi:hypothetical protein
MKKFLSTALITAAAILVACSPDATSPTGPHLTPTLTAKGNCTANSGPGTFTLTFTITNTSSVPIEIVSGSTFDIRDSNNNTIGSTVTSSTLTLDEFIPVGETYTYTITGTSNNQATPYYYDVTTNISDGNGHTNTVTWTDDQFTVSVLPIVTAKGNCTAVSYSSGVFSLTFTVTNTGNVPIEILTSTSNSSWDIRGSLDATIDPSYYTYSSTLTTGFIGVGQSYTYTISGTSQYIAYYYDAVTTVGDGNGNNYILYWTNDSFTYKG